MNNQHNAIADALELHFEGSTVVQEMTLHKLVLDFAVIVNDSLYEIEQINYKDDIKLELDKMGRRGQFAFKKHQVLQHGFKDKTRMAVKCFYFLAPATTKIVANDIPDMYGLLTYRLKRTGEVELAVIKEATELHTEYLTKNFYKNLVGTLSKELKALRNDHTAQHHAAD